MSDREVEQEEPKGTVSRDVQAGIDAKRGGGASLDAGVQERLTPSLGPLTDVRIHTDTGAGTLARSVSARAFATGSDVYFAPGEYRPGSSDGDRLLAHELAHVVQQRGSAASGLLRTTEPGDAHELEADAMAAAALEPRPAPLAASAGREAIVARDFIDDIGSLFGGTTEAKREPREVAVTKQDFDQILNLVSLPLEMAKQQLTGDADVQKAKAAAAKLAPAASALHVIAKTKKEPKTRDNLYRPLDEIEASVTTLKVMGEPDKAKEIWKKHFDGAMKVIDQVLALPIRDESQNQDQPAGGAPAANPDETITQRDHDLIQVSLKPQLQQLIDTTSGEPHTDWDPKTVMADTAVPVAINAFSHRKLNSARIQVALGLQAITTFDMSMNDQQAEAVKRMEAASIALAQAMSSFTTSDPTDPNSPSYVPPATP